MSDDHEWVGTISADVTDGIPLTVDGARNLLTYSRESAERLLGLYGQDQEIYDWAERSGYQIVGRARDNSVHGQMPANVRPGLSAAIHAIEEGKAAGIVVERLDRIARDFQTQDDAMRRIWEAGGRIFTCSKEEEQEWKPDRPGDKQWTTRRAFAFRAEEEMYALIARLEGGRRRKMARGGYGGGPRFGGRRYGVALVQLRGQLEYIPIPEEQAVIHRIKNFCRDGKGYTAMAKQLNIEKVPTVTGAPWSMKVVRSIALRPADRLTVVTPEPIAEPLEWVRPVEALAR